MKFEIIFKFKYGPKWYMWVSLLINPDLRMSLSIFIYLALLGVSFAYPKSEDVAMNAIGFNCTGKLNPCAGRLTSSFG